MLYCFLEAHLEAPKLLTKLELKTAQNDYVKGADGVHLLKLNHQEYQIVLGESKLNSDLKAGIYESFGSLAKLLKDSNGKLRFEEGLIHSNLVKEAYDDVMYEHIKNILLPKAQEDQTYLDYSFGIFLGFNIEMSMEEKNLSNAEFRQLIRDKVKNEVLSVMKSVNFQIQKAEFSGYDFHIYVVPFMDLKSKRKEIIRELSQ